MRSTRRLLALAFLTGAVAVVAAQAQDTPAVALQSAKLTSSWKESWLTGSVRFSGTVSAPAELRVSLRPRAGGKLAAAVTLPDIQPGKFGGELTLPPRLLPKIYRLTVSGTSGDAQLKPVHRDLKLPAPAEGVVDRAYTSATRSGRPALTLPGGRREIWAHFHFVVPPNKKTLRAAWHSPSFKWLGIAHKSYKSNIHTYVRTNARLEKGVWFCYLFSQGRVVKRARIRVG